MKVKFEFDFPENFTNNYLTKGKEYTVIPGSLRTPYDELLGSIVDDTGVTVTIKFNSCAHLNFKPWTIIEE